MPIIVDFFVAFWAFGGVVDDPLQGLQRRWTVLRYALHPLHSLFEADHVLVLVVAALLLLVRWRLETVRRRRQAGLDNAQGAPAHGEAVQ